MSEQLFLPVNKKEAHSRGWDELDFVVVSGAVSYTHLAVYKRQA